MLEACKKTIADRFLREARTFVNEMIEGTNNYRQLYSLSEQLPHDYHDRFIVELIQNANDASSGGEALISLDECCEDGFPRLYVANQGISFNQSNFAALCSLGLSDKDPQEAIGNKGLGFRSVLQVCRSPRIFSVAENEHDSEQDKPLGYCFQLSPDSRQILVGLISELLGSSDDVPERSQILMEYFNGKKTLVL